MKVFLQQKFPDLWNLMAITHVLAEQWNLCTVYTHPTFTVTPSHPIASLSANCSIIL